MVTPLLVIGGSADVGAIVWTPAAGIANAIVCGPGLPFASRIACRSDPRPESEVVVTVKTAAEARPPRDRRTAATAAAGWSGDRMRDLLRRSLILRILPGDSNPIE